MNINTRRWAGVPFYLRTGKRLGRRVTEIAVIFKRAPHLPFDSTDTAELGQNALVIRVQPDEGVTMRFGSKVPGTTMEVRDVTMDFGYGHAFTEVSPEAYERLILDMLLGEPSLFPVNEEVELSWKLLDPVLNYWAGNGRPDGYPAGSWGPASADKMLNRYWTSMEAPVIIDLPSTTTSQVNNKLVELRQEGGATTLGRVLNLVIVTDDGTKTEAAIDAANEASHEHPCRVIVVARGAKKAAARLDAQIRFGGDAGASEVVVLRLYGPLADEGASSVLPLLLPDTPVVAWWPSEPPAGAGEGPDRSARAPADHRLGQRQEPDQGAGAAARRLHRWRHRPGLDQADPLARIPRRRAGPAALREGDRGAGGRRGRLAVDGSAGRVAGHLPEDSGDQGQGHLRRGHRRGAA